MKFSNSVGASFARPLFPAPQKSCWDKMLWNEYYFTPHIEKGLHHKIFCGAIPMVFTWEQAERHSGHSLQVSVQSIACGLQNAAYKVNCEIRREQRT